MSTEHTKERAEFDKWYDAFEFRKEYDKYGPTEAAWLAWSAALVGRATPAPGWKLVPIEPTPEMVNAPNTIIQAYGARLIYQRMLEAAPTKDDQ